jgi:UDP-N-acetyl-D-mannosaminuronic acid dehydrogenase
MPMAALLADVEAKRGPSGRRVLVVQRNSATSGWKVGAINRGESPIGGAEPNLDAIVRRTVASGHLGATHEVQDLADAEIVLVCVQTDKDGIAPDYVPLFAALDALAAAFRTRRSGLGAPLVIIESTLAPSSMATVVRERFAKQGLIEGQHVRLANSPNRVMPGRLVARVAASDKLVGALAPETAAEVAQLYAGIVTAGTLHVTDSLTAEIVKTLENAYRDVRIAFSAELARWCDAEKLDFFDLRDRVNAGLAQEDTASQDPTAVPHGGVLVPTVGVGGHCLPKDGVLLWWRRLEVRDPAAPRSLILASRVINDASPNLAWVRVRAALGDPRGKRIAVLGAAYRAESEDTRNSAALIFAKLAREAGADVIVHDPFVKPDDVNIRRLGLEDCFTQDLDRALSGADALFAAVVHEVYRPLATAALKSTPAPLLFDFCTIWRGLDLPADAVVGIGYGRTKVADAVVQGVIAAFRNVERAVSREVRDTDAFLRARYGGNGAQGYEDVRRLAATCVTGCELVDASLPVEPVTLPFTSRLLDLATGA